MIRFFCQNLAAGTTLTKRGNPLIQSQDLICGAPKEVTDNIPL